MTHVTFAERRHRAGTALFLAMWCALTSGVILAVEYAAERNLRGHIVWVDARYAWMAPLGQCLVFLGPAVAAAALAWLAPGRVRLGWILGVFAFLGAFSLLLPYGQIGQWAATPLALGVTVQLARAYAAAPERWLAHMRRSGIALAAVVLAATGILEAHSLIAQRRAGRSGRGVARDVGPNILLIVLDTVRRTNLGMYGYHRATTPHLDRRVREGTLFAHALATAPWTLPSHASLFTGRSPISLSYGRRQRIAGRPRTIADVLDERGYATAGFAANLLYASWESGFAGGLRHFDDYPAFSFGVVIHHAPLIRVRVVERLVRSRSLGQVLEALATFSLARGALPADEGRRNATQIVDRFLAWQPGAAGRPFFAFINLFDAHAPYDSPAPYRTAFDEGRQAMDRYDGAIAYLDAEVARLLDSLQARGVLDRTIVVITSDHGEQFGEHGLAGHANSLYLPLLTVPLYIRYPGTVPAGHLVQQPVSLRDVPATILSLAGAGAETGIGGSSLRALWGGTSAAGAGPAFAELLPGLDANPHSPNARDTLWSLTDSAYHYVRSSAGREELYAWRTDSRERWNLVRDKRAQAALDRLRQQMRSLRSGR